MEWSCGKRTIIIIQTHLEPDGASDYCYQLLIIIYPIIDHLNTDKCCLLKYCYFQDNLQFFVANKQINKNTKHLTYDLRWERASVTVIG